MSLADVLAGKRPEVKKEDPPKPKDLLDLMKEKLTSSKEFPPPTANMVYRVSSLVRMCPRQEALKFNLKLSTKEKIDFKLQKTFDFGSAMHWWAQNKWFGPWGILIGVWRCKDCSRSSQGYMPNHCECGSTEFLYEELHFRNDELGIEGHPDGIIDLGSLKVLEIKTCNSIQFQLVASQRKDAYEAHKDQAQLYMFLSGVKEAIVLYLEKDQHQIHDFHYAYDDYRIQKILNRLKQAREAMVTGILPPRELCEDKGCARAKTCPVKKECFEGG